MDYRTLLKKYIDHIYNCEGVTFIDAVSKNRSSFSDDEWRELEQLENELRAEWAERRK